MVRAEHEPISEHRRLHTQSLRHTGEPVPRRPRPGTQRRRVCADTS